MWMIVYETLVSLATYNLPNVWTSNQCEGVLIQFEFLIFYYERLDQTESYSENVLNWFIDRIFSELSLLSNGYS